jgi:hypothetical protein
MDYLLGANHTIGEVREETSAEHSGEEVHVVQPLVGQSNVLETSHGNVHSHPRIHPPAIEGEITAMLLNPQ